MRTIRSFRLPAFAALVSLLVQGMVAPASAIDNNGNGLSDPWELYYGAVGVLPRSDDDRDGKTNLEESRAGTDPFDASDCLRIATFEKQGENGTLRFTTQPGKRYTVYRTRSLDLSLWSRVDPEVVGDGSVRTFPVSGLSGDSAFFRVGVKDGDRDGDGLSDWAESVLDGFDPDSDFSADPDRSDAETFAELFGASDEPVRVTLTLVEGESFEKAGGSGAPRMGRFLLRRTGNPAPVTVFYSTAGSADETDAVLRDGSGNAAGGFVAFGFGEMSRELRVVPVVDSVADFPVDLDIALDPHDDYDVDGAASGRVTIYDADDRPENAQLFYGQVTPERGAVTNGSGFATLRLNGRRNRALVDFRFSGLSSTQTAAHVHQSRDNGSGGITNGPVVESLPLGVIDDYVWNIGPTGAYSGQDLIDALYGQDGTFPLYVNAHTTNAPGGELWAFFSPYEGDGSFDPPVPPPSVPTEVDEALRQEVVRFLTQATFGPRETEVDALVDSVVADFGGDRIAAFDAWIDAQFALPRTSIYELNYALDQEEWSMNGNDPKNANNPQPFHNNQRIAWFSGAIGGKDQLRQRVGFALSQILVISDENASVRRNHYGAGAYFDMLAGHADGNYRRILVDVSKSPMMAKYLSHLQNRKATFDGNGNQITSPDENYAREIMQLFSIGLVHLHPDGSLKLDENGEPVATYGNEDITELARVFTGWSFSKKVGSRNSNYPTQNNNNFTYYGGPRYFQASWMHPLKNFGNYHDTGAKVVLGKDISSGLNGEQDLQAAIDILFNHPNIAPFVARRMIQRFVTSNPSSGYIYRVARAFEGAGGGQRGDMKAVVKAVLLDYEARALQLRDDISYGKQKEPLLRYLQLIRTAGGGSQLPLADLANHGLSAARIAAYEPGATQIRLYDLTGRTGQSPGAAPSVFNWFLPDYVLGGPLAENGLVVPEFTITSESQVVEAINTNHSTIMSSIGMYGRPRYGKSGRDPEHRILLGLAALSDRLGGYYESAAGDNNAKERSAATRLLDEFDLLLCAGAIQVRYGGVAEPNPRSAILENMTGVWYGADDDSNNNDRLQAVKDMLYIIAASPDYLIQR